MIPIEGLPATEVKKKGQPFGKPFIYMVAMRGFEPRTPAL